MPYLIETLDPRIGPYILQKKLRSAFVLSLRESFKTDPNYTYVNIPNSDMTDFLNTKVEVTDTYALETIKIPTIVISKFSDRGSTFFFGDDLIESGPDTKTRGNILLGNVGIDVFAFSSIERDEICDKVYYYLRVVRDKLGPLGIELREVKADSPSEAEYGGRILYKGGISTNTISEWIITEDIGEDRISEIGNTLI